MKIKVEIKSFIRPNLSNIKCRQHFVMGWDFFKFIINVNYRPFEDCPKTPIRSAKSGAICTACSILHFFINCLALSIVDAPQFYVNNSLLINPSLPISVPES